MGIKMKWSVFMCINMASRNTLSTPCKHMVIGERASTIQYANLKWADLAVLCKIVKICELGVCLGKQACK